MIVITKIVINTEIQILWTEKENACYIEAHPFHLYFSFHFELSLASGIAWRGLNCIGYVSDQPASPYSSIRLSIHSSIYPVRQQSTIVVGNLHNVINKKCIYKSLYTFCFRKLWQGRCNYFHPEIFGSLADINWLTENTKKRKTNQKVVIIFSIKKFIL